MPERLFRAAMVRWLDEMANGGVFTTDDALVIRSWNKWLERVTGRLRDAVVGRELFEVFPEIVHRGLDRYYRAALRGEVSVLAHRFHGHLLRVSTPGGDMPQTSRVAPLTNSDAIIGTVTVIEDVSERMNSENELRRQIASAEQARAAAEEALRMKDEFLATLSHELRTPLNAVLGWTNILLGHSVDPEMLDRALRVIDRNAVAQARLIDDMLDVARIMSGKLRLEMGPVDLVAATLAAVDVVAPAAQAKNVTIRKRLHARPSLITADADRVQQIAWNILSNAVKFTPPGGTIDVKIDQEPDAIRLIVSDTGRGIPPDFLPHVFERFRQANSSVSRTEGGLGLGLALVRQLVEMHGGRIAVASAGPGQGATFTVSFPSVVTEAAADDVRVETPRVSLDARRVMIVDDDGDWRDLLQTVLMRDGAEVIAVSTAQDALAIIVGDARRRPDVLVADIGLPGEDGYALMRRIRALDGAMGRIGAVAVTAYATAESQRRALEAGFDAYRSKPITADAVAATVGAVLKTRGLPRRLGRAADGGTNKPPQTSSV